MRKIEQEGKERDEDKTHQQSWRWGELPSPPPESAHALNITTTSTQPNDSKSRKIFNIFHKRKKNQMNVSSSRIHSHIHTEIPQYIIHAYSNALITIIKFKDTFSCQCFEKSIFKD